MLFYDELKGEESVVAPGSDQEKVKSLVWGDM